MSQATSPAGQDVAVPTAPEATARNTSPGQDVSLNTNGSGGSANIPLSFRGATGAMIAAQRAQMSAVARDRQEATILAMVRKQIDAVEEKLFHQLERVAQQADKGRDSASRSVDQKLTSLELKQNEFQRSIAA